VVAQPAGLLFSKDHEWVKFDGDVATIGITDYAQSSFGNIGVVESVKAVSDIFTPLGGEVVEINPALEGDPALVNRDAFGEGWFYKVKLADDSEKSNLMAGDAYDKLVAEA
jgi:glycine cleavage system H protein